MTLYHAGLSGRERRDATTAFLDGSARIIAATAERERLTVLCDDRDFQAIARITSQPVKFVTDI